jgi:sporulation protein YlmC with PRC-barrel domain
MVRCRTNHPARTGTVCRAIHWVEEHPNSANDGDSMRRTLLVTMASFFALSQAVMAQTSALNQPSGTANTTSGQSGSGKGGQSSGPTSNHLPPASSSSGSGSSATDRSSANDAEDNKGASSQTGGSRSQSPTSRSATPQTGLRQVDPAADVRLTFYTVQPADFWASKLIGSDVYNLQNEYVGEVGDLIIDNGKTIKAVVVSVGGFLGIGERNVALNPRSIVLSALQDGSVRMVVNTTTEDLKKAPPFDFAETDRPGGRTKTTGSPGAGRALRPTSEEGKQASDGAKVEDKGTR